jgi:excisionase family DNA binding protein
VNDDTMLVTMTAAQLETLMERVVDKALQKSRGGAQAGNGDVMNSEEAADFLRMPVGTLRKRTRKGEIPSCKIGSLLRYRRSELQAWLDSLTEKKAG